MGQDLVHTDYAIPPREHNAQGEPRRVGLEIELAGLSLNAALALVQGCFGGTIDAISPTQGSVLETPFGPFKVEYSLHFHAVKEPGPGFDLVAREPRGVPQAIEHRIRKFWLGVQWHPEYLPQQRSHQELFRALVRAARPAMPPASPRV